MKRNEIEILNSYLIKNMGAKMKIIEENILDNLKIPLVLKRMYPSARAEFMNQNCLLLFPEKNINTKDFLHEMQRIQSKLKESFDDPFRIVIILPKANKNILSFFIEHRVPFIVGHKQIYLPFVYLDIKFGEDEIEKFTPSYQLVFLYILYSSDNAVFNAAVLAEKTSLAEMTVRRALKYLEELQLIFELEISKNQLYRRTFSKRETFEKAKEYLITPIQKKLYFNMDEVDIASNDFDRHPFSGEMALSALTQLMYNKTYGNIYAMNNKSFKKMRNYDELLENSSKLPFDFQRTFSLELWRYDPKVLSKICYPNVNCVDVVSLWLILKDIYDERIQMELEFLLNDYFEKE